MMNHIEMQSELAVDLEVEFIILNKTMSDDHSSIIPIDHIKVLRV